MARHRYGVLAYSRIPPPACPERYADSLAGGHVQDATRRFATKAALCRLVSSARIGEGVTVSGGMPDVSRGHAQFVTRTP